MKKLFSILAVLLCPLLLCSCATIISGRTQKLPVNTNPIGAKITCNGVEQVSPCVIMLDRNEPSYTIVIEKEGYEPTQIELKRGLNGWIVGNILFGGIIGVVVDICSGSVYQFYPSEVKQNLSPTEVLITLIEE